MSGVTVASPVSMRAFLMASWSTFDADRRFNSAAANNARTPPLEANTTQLKPPALVVNVAVYALLVSSISQICCSRSTVIWRVHSPSGAVNDRRTDFAVFSSMALKMERPTRVRSSPCRISMLALNGVLSDSPPFTTKNERVTFSPALTSGVYSTFSNAKSGPMLLSGASSHGFSSEFPVSETSAKPASSMPSAQQASVAWGERVEGSPSSLKSYVKLNIVLPLNTVVALRTKVMGSQFTASERIWHVSVNGDDHACSSSMLTPTWTLSKW